MSMWHWSWRAFSVAGVEVRLHWTLLVLALYYGLRAAADSTWWLLPIFLLIPFLSILLHEFGHVTAARLVGGSSHRVILWMFGGLAACEVPATPGKQFFVAAAGPLVNLFIMCLCLLALGRGISLNTTAVWDNDWGAYLLSYTAAWNASNLLFNLLPVYPMDGGRMLRAGLWPVLGRRPAIITTIYIAYVGIGAALIWAGITGNLLLFGLAAGTLMMVFQEHQSVKRGVDPYTGDSDWDFNGTPERAIFQRWRAQRMHRNLEKQASEVAAEQEVLDRLLAKVGEHGLPSLTPAERKQLQKISQRQKERSQDE